MGILGILDFFFGFWGDFRGILWKFIGLFVKILVFVKILGKGRRRKEGRKISIFRSASASSSHLKKILGETF